MAENIVRYLLFLPTHKFLSYTFGFVLLVVDKAKYVSFIHQCLSENQQTMYLRNFLHTRACKNFSDTQYCDLTAPIFNLFLFYINKRDVPIIRKNKIYNLFYYIPSALSFDDSVN